MQPLNCILLRLWWKKLYASDFWLGCLQRLHKILGLVFAKTMLKMQRKLLCDLKRIWLSVYLQLNVSNISAVDLTFQKFCWCFVCFWFVFFPKPKLKWFIYIEEFRFWFLEYFFFFLIWNKNHTLTQSKYKYMCEKLIPKNLKPVSSPPSPLTLQKLIVVKWPHT